MIVPLLATLLAVATSVLHIVDDRGAPVVGATVALQSAAGASITVVSDADGAIGIPANFVATSARVTAAGYGTVTVQLSGTSAPPIVLAAPAAVIGKVSVATGSARNLHRLAVPAGALDRVTIATTPAYTTDALLRALPGFDFVRSNSSFTNYGNLRVSFAGAGEDRGIVLVDDVPAQDGFGGQVDWLAYPPSALGSAELLRGPGAALYGANAIGGVLQLRSVAPATNWVESPRGTLELADGTPHRTNANVAYRFTLAPNLTAAIATQTGHQAYNDLPPGYQSAVDREATASSTATRAQLRYGFGASSLTFGGLFANDAQFEGRPSYTFARTLTQADLHFATALRNSTLGIVAYDRNTDIINTNDQFPAKPGALRYVQTIPTRESGIAASWFSTHTFNEVAVRADERFIFGNSVQNGPTGALQSAGTGKQQHVGLALEDTYERGRVQVIAGLRGDVVTFFDGRLQTPKIAQAPSRNDRVLSPRLAARYDVASGIALRASTGGGFREPFLNELVRGYRIGSVSYNPNVNLTSERSTNYGFGADALVGAGRISLDVTSTKVDNAIAFLTVNPTTQVRSNLGRTQTDGTTLTYTTQLARCTRLRAYATSQYARVTKGPPQDVGNRLQYVPSRSGDIAVDAGSGALDYGIDVGYAGVTYADDLNRQILPAAVLVGAHLTRPLGDGAAITLEGTNLTGTRYLSSIDRYGPPPSVNLRLRFGLGPQTQPAIDQSCP